MKSRHAELCCQSCYSFLDAASHPEELVMRAAEQHYAALAITDECSVAGIVKAHIAIQALPEEPRPRLLIGSLFRLEEGDVLILLVSDGQGYANLCRLITAARGRAKKGKYRLQRADLPSHAGGLLALWQVDPTGTGSPQWLQKSFAGRLWLACPQWQDGQDRVRRERARTLSESLGLPIVAIGGAKMHVPNRKPLLDVMTAISLNTTVQEAGELLLTNARRHLRPMAELAELYPSDWLEEARRVADQCQFSLDSLRYQYPEDDIPPGITGAQRLRELTEAGLRERWPQGVPEKVRRLIEHELTIIGELNYEAYFLTVHDIVRFARSRGILCQGRGSAANSAVCYALGITAVNPAESSMLFERFISKERNEPPDIDVDFEHARREEVIQYIYQRYGRDRAALAASVITYRRRSALRDVGRALGIETTLIERLSANLSWWEREVDPARMQEVGLDPNSPVVSRWLSLTRALCGFPRHLSQHVGGFVIAKGRLTDLVPVEQAAMAGRSVIQWDKNDLEALGLMKVDVLALGMLSAIRRALEYVATHRGRDLSLWQIPRDDPATWRMIQQADTIGVFQIESRAQMSMLPRLKPKCFYDLVIEIAIVRPGPIQGQMVHPYLRRRQGLESVDYPSEEVAHILKRTLGVPIFQEQVIELAMVAGGFTAGEADQLRRALGAWKKKGQLEVFRERLYAGMIRRGYKAEFAEQIFNQILGFGEYGFPESHSASFALLAYASAWLKCHEPAAFYCALLNSQPMGFYAPAQLVQDARRHGIEVRPVSINHSLIECSLEPSGTDLALRLGLQMVKGLNRQAAARLVAAREQGNFTDVENLAQRAGLGKSDLAALARAGAFAELTGNRHAALWEAQGIQTPPAILKNTPTHETAPSLHAPTEAENLLADYATLGLTLGRHPLSLLRPKLENLRLHTAISLKTRHSGAHVRYAGLVTIRQRPGSANGTVFLTMEDETGIVNTIVWPSQVARFRREVTQGMLLEVRGQWQIESGVYYLVAGFIRDISYMLGKLEVNSRDFH